MIDPLIETLSEQRQTISKDQFNQWKRDPVTRELFLDLTTALLDNFWSDIGTGQDSASIAQRREGAKAIMEEIQQWEPQSVKTDKEGDDANS